MVWFLLVDRCRCEPWLRSCRHMCMALHRGTPPTTGACETLRAGLCCGLYLSKGELPRMNAICPQMQPFLSCRLPPIFPCKKPFAQTPDHHRLPNSKCSAAPNGVTWLAERLSIMPLAAPLPPFNHSPLCSSVFTTLPSIRETLVFTCTEPTKKNSF